MKRIAWLLVMALLLNFSNSTRAQVEFKYGFGVGANFSNISEINAYPIFEDISGEAYPESYSSLFENRGIQYFFHGDLYWSGFIVTLKPGTYRYSFTKYNSIVFTQETIEQSSPYLLRYFNIPLEIKYAVGNNKLKPYAGASIAYGRLLQQAASDEQAIIQSRFTAGPVLGAYYSLSSADLVLSLGYDIGLHPITNQSNRFSTGTIIMQSQGNIKLNALHASLSVLFSITTESNNKKVGALDCPPFNSRKPKNKRK